MCGVCSDPRLHFSYQFNVCLRSGICILATTTCLWTITRCSATGLLTIGCEWLRRLCLGCVKRAPTHGSVAQHFCALCDFSLAILFLNTSTCFAQLFGVGVPLLLRRSMLGARSQGQRIHVSVARKVAEDHGIPEADAADALAYVSTQQRFAFLSAGFRPGYLHWHVSCPLLASHASRAGTLRAHRRPSPLIAAGSRGTCSANCFSFLWFAPAVLRGHVLSGLDLVLADACLLPPDHRFLRPRPAGWHRLRCAGPRC